MPDGLDTKLRLQATKPTTITEQTETKIKKINTKNKKKTQ